MHVCIKCLVLTVCWTAGACSILLSGRGDKSNVIIRFLHCVRCLMAWYLLISLLSYYGLQGRSQGRGSHRTLFAGARAGKRANFQVLVGSSYAVDELETNKLIMDKLSMVSLQLPWLL